MNIFRYIKLKIALAIPASNEGKHLDFGDVYFFTSINIFRYLKLDIALAIPVSNE